MRAIARDAGRMFVLLYRSRNYIALLPRPLYKSQIRPKLEYLAVATQSLLSSLDMRNAALSVMNTSSLNKPYPTDETLASHYSVTIVMTDVWSSYIP